MDHIIELYKEEINNYKQQIEELRERNAVCDDKNATLISRIRSLEDVLEKANVANKDLNTAFEHIREENMRLQLKSSSQEPQIPAITHDEPESKAVEQYANLASESLTWISERDRMNQRIKFLERECSRYHRDNTTLGKQVRHLLRSLEEERGMIIRHQSQLNEDDKVVCAADVIDKHLVTFESIEQLQQQNQKLLTLVKNLSAEQEERDIQVESEEVKKLSSELEQLKSQLDSVKTDRERIFNALNTIHKERDLFKILLCKTRQVEHMTPEIFQRMVSIACASGPAIADKAEITAEKEAHIGDLKEMINKLEQDLGKTKRELQDSKQYAAEEIKLKNDLLEKAHMKILEEQKRADVLNERNGVLESNLTALTTDYDELRTKCHKMTYELDKFKQLISEADATKDKLTKALETEKQLYQKICAELDECKVKCLHLNESVEKERQSRVKESEDTAHLKELNQQLIRSLDQERGAFFEAIERERQSRQQEISMLLQGIQSKTNQAEYSQLEAELTEANNNLARANDELNRSNQELNRVNQELNKANHELNRVITELDRANHDVTRLKNDIVKKNDELDTLEHELDNAKASISAFRELRDIERDLRIQLAKRLRTTRMPVRRRPKRQQLKEAQWQLGAPTKSERLDNTDSQEDVMLAETVHDEVMQDESMLDEQHEEPREELHEVPNEQAQDQGYEIHHEEICEAPRTESRIPRFEPRVELQLAPKFTQQEVVQQEVVQQEVVQQEVVQQEVMQQETIQVDPIVIQEKTQAVIQEEAQAVAQEEPHGEPQEKQATQKPVEIIKLKRRNFN